MKATGYLFLLLFIAFQATPIVMNLLKANSELFVIAMLDEEDIHDTELQLQDELLSEFKADTSINFLEFHKVKTNFSYYKTDYGVFLDPVSPPPRLI